MKTTPITNYQIEIQTWVYVPPEDPEIHESNIVAKLTVIVMALAMMAGLLLEVVNG